jgi:hypothetical protein
MRVLVGIDELLHTPLSHLVGRHRAGFRHDRRRSIPARVS